MFLLMISSFCMTTCDYDMCTVSSFNFKPVFTVRCILVKWLITVISHANRVQLYNDYVSDALFVEREAPKELHLENSQLQPEHIYQVLCF